MQRSKGSMQKKSNSNFHVVIVKRTWFAAQIYFQSMHGVLSYKLDFIIWRIRDSCLRKISRCWSRPGVCDQCYGKPFEDIMKSIVGIRQK